MGRNIDHSKSPVRGRSPPHRKSPSRRERSPKRHRSSHKGGSPIKEKPRSDVKSPKHGRSISPFPRSRSRSPSPRTKRLRRAQAESESRKSNEREHEKNRGRGSERGLHKERGQGKEIGSERKERRSERDDLDSNPSRSRHSDASPSERHQRSRHRSYSPQPSVDNKNQEREKVNERGQERNNGRGSNRAIGEGRQDREMEGVRTERRSRRDDDHKSLRSKDGISTSPSSRHHRNKHRSQSPQPIVDTRARDEVSIVRESEERDNEDDSVSKMKVPEDALAAKQKEKPSFELSGKLAAETNRVRGITLLFNEPPDARKPDVRWRLYVFKNGEVLNEPLYIHRQSCYLFGRERRVADVPTDHPSCSKQHAVIQFRQVEKEKPDGTLTKQVKPYVMDLGSTNKTFLNDVAIESERYYELHEKDTIKFGNSSREYVLLHENSAQ
ncbi:FHA domain-containing protein DDL [Humulus lupulus]|uniref:FHA domain-containing protein DDL n=1 Tax=Humulus lupulus TaxID=3486 RepID=UPI002B4132D0|nr:FHA domain-containing protein DDL [Humulus lupulus]XP_062077777.1 FHA domain-containing protein DDL [Humulus lupulus]